jgi:pseudouridine kinase
MNLDEANAILGRRSVKSMAEAQAAAVGLQQAGAREAIVTMGAEGIAVAGIEGMKVFPAITAAPVDMTGAGDAMIAGTLHRLMAGDDLYDAARVGALVGAITTESPASVHPQLSPTFLDANLHRITA